MNPWLLTYEGFDPADEGQREAMCTLGNGYFATRGALPESEADGVHYPGTYVAGLFNRLSSEIEGRIVENESVVNVPNWLVLRFRLVVDGEPGPWLDENSAQVAEHRVELDLHRGVLTRFTRFVDADGHGLRVTQRRLVSMASAHLAALETTLVAEGFDGQVIIESALDGTVANTGVVRYQDLPSEHLEAESTHVEADGSIGLTVITNQSRVRVALAARTRIHCDGVICEHEVDYEERPRWVASRHTVPVSAGNPVTVEKIISLFTGRDLAVTEAALEAREAIAALGDDGFYDLLLDHERAWRHLWAHMDLEVGANHGTGRLVHLNMFHAMVTVSPHSAMLDAGVPARGLHGEAYRGHIFWDELFIFPFLSLCFPQLSRALLLYRYRRLDQARRNAVEAGYEGAMFPWQSASNGREETQTMHLNPVSGRWLPDASHLQRHVNAAVAVNVWQYYQATEDLEFLRFHGAEMIFEIARFWASSASYNRGLDRYEIKGVMGPDEYHEGYPDRDEPGLDNNAYTNLMAVWSICRAFDLFDVLPPDVVLELRERLMITPEDLARWTDISRKMRVCFHDGVISQFEGYEQLEELDWDHYRTTYGDIHRLDRILEAEGDSPNRYQLSKQPDVMMLFYVLSADELTDLLVRLGYGYDPEVITRSVDYYTPRSAHGSTLSRVVQAWILARQDREQSWKIFVDALRSDFDDVQGGTTPEGIHLGAMGGTVDLLQRCYSGIETREDALHLDPVIPLELGRLAFDIHYRGLLVALELTPELARVRIDMTEASPITIKCRGRAYQLQPGNVLEIDLT